ncbi:MAG TPA: hypothetical protein VGP25_02440 [Gemmatimonadaceae bacterium]|nr:hypothetical protein [Gemmatimonadaceae bacterium]
MESLGSHWRRDLVLMALVVFCFGAVRPLVDPDLPMHLAVGEWIVRHRAVPFVEPFAWTRAGAPYYAYSWLPETVFYLVLDAFGHLGLRALQGLLEVATAAAALLLARAAGARPGPAIMVAGFNLIVATIFIAALRPQTILLVTIPLIGASFYRIVAGENVVRNAMVIFTASALTANSHLFFPLTLAPAALVLVYRPSRTRDAVLGVASVIAGWLTSPYSLHWLEVFRSNFAPNALYRPPSAITELQPGFVALLYPSPSALLVPVAGMLSIPWVLARATLSARERVMAALCWSLGLVAFGYATRLFVLWWLLAIVPAMWAVAHLTRDTEDAPPRLRFRLLGLAASAVIVAAAIARGRQEWALEGDTARRTLPTYGALATEPLAALLESHAVPRERARLMTSFNNGSYLTWRLPQFSASLDSRGIPDSVSVAEAVVLASDRDVPVGPWRFADAAIIPLRFRAAAVLDTATGWRRIAAVPGRPVARDSTGLWARAEWWERSATTKEH